MYVPWLMYMQVYGSYKMSQFVAAVPQKVSSVCFPLFYNLVSNLLLYCHWYLPD